MVWAMDATVTHPLDLLLRLAQVKHSVTRDQQWEILYWSVVLILLATVLGLAGFFLYRRLKRANEPISTEPAGFSLSEMRRLYEAGEVSHEEFMQVKERILAAARKSMAAGGPIVQVHAQTPPPTEQPGPAAPEPGPEARPAPPPASAADPNEPLNSHHEPPTDGGDTDAPDTGADNDTRPPGPT